MTPSSDAGGGVAIIGMAGRFPGARNVREFWRNLQAGVESITFFAEQPRGGAGGPAGAPGQDGWLVGARGVLEEAELFDAGFFGIAPSEAEVMDPQHRVFLEAAWEALEDAGCDPGAYPGLIGLFAGMSPGTYFQTQVAPHRELVERLSDLHAVISREPDFLTTRVAYKLNLRGPCMAVQTACSTSLVAVGLAWQSLMTHQCDIALAGGVSITFPQHEGYRYQEGGIGSRDGHCRAFDAAATGTVFGHGAGIVVLKRVDAALAEGDHIYAVIRSVAVNNDGGAKVSYAAPGVDGQAEVIAAAQALAGINPRTVSYVEAHGTGTPLGDPIEVAALTQAFRTGTPDTGFCAIGSVKTNIGHLDAAAGVAGLMKTALALEHRLLPPSLHFMRPNPRIDFANSPFYVNASLRPWPATDSPRRAGVSSFGIGGTNAHVVLEEAPSVHSTPPACAEQLVVVSAKTRDALDTAAAGLVRHLREHPESSLADLAFTLQTGRRRFEHRCAVVARDVAELAGLLEGQDTRRVLRGEHQGQEARVAFLFPGQGAQRVGMGAQLYRVAPAFREEVDACAEWLAAPLGLDLRRILYPEAGERPAAERLLGETRLTQPALFVTEYALARLWIRWGIRPSAMIGQSLGEYVAACLADALSREDALALVVARAALMQTVPPGAMLAVRLPAKPVESLLGPDLSVAALNAPSVTVVSGPVASIEALERRLGAERVACSRLGTSHAFHSGSMDVIIPPFRERVRSVTFRPPRIPWVSSLTGDWITAAQASDPEYWVQQLRQPVRFSDGIGRLFEDPRAVLLEVGPGETLRTMVARHPDRPRAQLVLTSLARSPALATEAGSMLEALGRLWVVGDEVDWASMHGASRRQRVSLPAYPFQRKRYWIGPPTEERSHIPMADEPAAQRGPARPPESNGPAQHAAQAAPTGCTRHAELTTRLQALFADLAGLERESIDVGATFAELGLDSLFLTQAGTAIQKSFGVAVSFRQLMEELSTVDALAAHLDALLPIERSEPSRPGARLPATPPGGISDRTSVREAVSAATVESEREAARSGPVTSVLERVVSEQLALMARQLELLQEARSSQREASPPGTRSGGRAPEVMPVGGSREAGLPTALTVPPPGAAEAPQASGPFRPARTDRRDTLTAAQQAYVSAFVSRYTARTAGSKRHAASHRPHLADPRSVAGFRLLWKEIVYPLVVERSSGSRIWDIDGNEYVDLVNGFGANLFGHSPPFVLEAVERQLRKGVEIGPQTPLAGQVAELVCDLTGVERVAFCNTGSEAVAAALRVARTVTGRDKVALFAGSYHGVFDEVLVRPSPAERRPAAIPLAPGIPATMVGNVLVLEYGAAESLELLRARVHELAAVIVEPVPSRRPDLRSREFLQALRTLTAEAGTALVFDEIVTGFRVHPGGVQVLFGIAADLVTYGKVVGGGFPIGLVAGKARFMDALDGGTWSYGDLSVPEVGVTFFAGTFVRHPVALAAAWAVLNHLKQRGPGVQAALNERTARFVHTLATQFDEVALPVQLPHFSSWFCLDLPSGLPLSSLFFPHVTARGVHVAEGRPLFLTTAHTDEDLDRVARAVRESVAEMQAAGLLPRAERPLAGVGRPVIGGEDDTPTAPLTDAQRELWMAAKMGEDASRAFVDSVTLELRGPLRVPAVKDAIEALVARHDALRLTFDRDGEEQRVARATSFEVPVRDLSGLDGAARSTRSTELVDAALQEPFDLSRGPMLRVQILRLAADRHLLQLTSHHLAVDGWSLGVLLSELARLYADCCAGRLPSLPPAPRFVDYARWQSRWRESEARKAAEAYWVEQFAGHVPVLELPTDRPRPASRTYTGARERDTLPVSLCEGLRDFAARQNSTLFATLLAGFKLLLHRLTGQEDVVVGIPAAGQVAVALPGLVGNCVNFLPLRSRIEPGAPLSRHLTGVKRRLLDGYEHQHYTYGSLVQRLTLPRDPSRSPLVAASFNFDTGGESLDFGDVVVGAVMFQPRTAVNFDIAVNVVETDGQLTVEWDYNTDLFEPETVRRWIGHFRTLLEGMVRDPQCPVGALPVLTPGERVQLVEAWNDTRLELPAMESVVEAVTHQVERTPERVAVESGGETLTYRELGRRADQLACHLRGLGVGPEVVVGLCVERSVDLVVGLLGVLQSGGAYLPLDPAHPSERLGFMLAEAAPPVLVTQTPLLDRLPAHGAKVVCLDRQRDEMAPIPRVERSGGVTPDTLAYLIYTSGSTGQPKGVEIPHRAVINLLHAMQQHLELTERDAWLSVTTLSFDIAVLELLLPLMVGARVVVMEPDGVADPSRLSERLTGSGITIMQATPTTWQQLLEYGWKGHPGLTILCGGEALPRDLAAALLDRATRVWNVYGPTETTVWSTAFRVTAAEGAVLIGRPIANTQVYVLDAQGHPVPIGVPGELHIGGLGVARGYFKRPELTRERFVSPPAGEGPGVRVYRTGDRVRFRSDRNLEFLGRLDDQVKVRGYRIEPGEIETALRQHPAVRAAAVVACEKAPAERYLVGYLVTGNGPTPSPVELQQFLRTKLPLYMVPSAFVFLDMLPLTPNGKVDRRALPPPHRARAEGDKGYVPPRTPTEEVIARIWTDVLGVDRIGINDNFFDLGGHSLRATQIISRVRRALDLEIPLRRVFETPTVAGLAEYVELGRWAARVGSRETTVGVGDPASDREEFEL